MTTSSGAEHGFGIIGTPAHPYVMLNIQRLTRRGGLVDVPKGALASFHAHPMGHEFEQTLGPSDVLLSNRFNLDYFVGTMEGLWFYRRNSGMAPLRLRPGLSWTRGCN